MEKIEKLKVENKKYANGKSSKDCTYSERFKVYMETVAKSESYEERKIRINAYRCGW
jgi:hypothetical protein